MDICNLDLKYQNIAQSSLLQSISLMKMAAKMYFTKFVCVCCSVCACELTCQCVKVLLSLSIYSTLHIDLLL